MKQSKHFNILEENVEEKKNLDNFIYDKEIKVTQFSLNSTVTGLLEINSISKEKKEVIWLSPMIKTKTKFK